MKKGAVIKNSIIMQASEVYENSRGNMQYYAGVIKSDRALRGLELPHSIKEKQYCVMNKANNRKLKILFVTSEAAPFIKTGGLADVSGSPPFACKSSMQM